MSAFQRIASLSPFPFLLSPFVPSVPRDVDLSLTPEERVTRARKRRRRWIIVIAAVLVLAIGAIAARPTRNAIKAWQARRQAEKAFALIEQEKWKEAQEAAVAAYQLRSTEPEALRALARFLSRVRQPQAFEFWNRLKEVQALTPTDLRDEAAVALALGDQPRAEAAIGTLLAANDATALDWLLNAQLQLASGAADKALNALSKVLTDTKATPHEQLQATLLQLQAARTGNAEADERCQREAWQRIQQLSARDDAIGLESLLILARRQLATNTSDHGSGATSEQAASAGSPPPDDREPATNNRADAVPDLSGRIASHPVSKPAHKLLALDLLIHADPSRRSELIDRAVADWKDADTAARTALATWLNGKGEFQRTLDTIPLEVALQSADLFLQHVDALGALGRWEEIRRLLDAERFPLDPVIQHMYLARTNTQLGNKTAAENSWQRALEAASSDPRKLMMLADYAEKNGIGDTAEAAYTRATELAPKLRPAWAGRLRAAQAAKNTRRMHEVLAAMLERWPDDPAVQNDEAYTRLLLLPNNPIHPAVIEIEKQAERLVAATPTSLPHRTLLALSRLKQGRAADALEVYDGVQADAGALTPSALVVHAAVLAANGRLDDSSAEVRLLSRDALLPEEAAAVAELADSEP
jgi:hypothetical protein